MEKEGRGQGRPQSWKCFSVGMGSKMEVVLTGPHSSYRTQGRGSREGSGRKAYAPVGGGEKTGVWSPHPPAGGNEGEIIVQSGHRHNSTL